MAAPGGQGPVKAPTAAREPCDGLAAAHWAAAAYWGVVLVDLLMLASVALAVLVSASVVADSL